jgi:4-amino-4-deoxy-L-arabinose transferase-like glycosyltransferase
MSMQPEQAPEEGARKAPAAPGVRGFRTGVLVLLLLLVGSGLYGGFGPFVWGHYGYHAGEYSTRARHTLRHGTILPSNAPGHTVPDRDSYYLHHPILTHQLVTATLLVFGDREVAVRLAALGSTVAAFLLLVRLLRRYWGDWQALLGGALFVLVPIHVWFAAHIDPGMPGIACVLGVFLCYFSWLETGRRGAAFGVLALFALSGMFEWSPYLALVPLGLHALSLAVQRRGRYLGFLILFVVAGLLPLALHAGVVIFTQHLREMRESYLLRSGGPAPCKALAELSSGALELFSAPLLAVMAAWLVLLVRRAVLGRLRLRDLLPISFAFSLCAYVALFRNGVIVHLYRLLYGGVLGALCGVEVTEAVQAAASRLRRSGLSPRIATASFAAALILCTAPLSVRALVRSRAQGGVPLAASYDPQLKPRAFAQRVLSLTSPGDKVYNHASFIIRKDMFFSLDRDILPMPNLGWLASRPEAERRRGVVILLEPLASPAERAQLDDLTRHYESFRVHEYTLVDLRKPCDGAPRCFHREELAPPPPRSLWTRYLEGPYAHPTLRPAAR